jgi:hypothetical protein
VTERCVLIHGLFYLPARENPWLEVIELQDSSYPYHDWNERITAECYGPNARSRILDSENRIVRIVNNYSRMSFNFGPTLLKWLADEEPAIYHAILEADEQSIQRFSAHGSALAQPYNHMILPLATARDKQTQIIWGIRDFEYRYGRRPEGMWLPETAVDIETLEALARAGILFTILSPHQAARVREIGGRNWKDISGGRIDPTRAYVQRLPSGRRISLFFYDGPISRAVAFEGLLDSGESFAERLVSGFSDQRTWPQLLHIATDGESYGHHHRFGDMALAYALEHIDSNEAATSPTTVSSWPNIRQRTRSRSKRTLPGAAATALSAGASIAAVTRESARGGNRPGVPRFATLWTGSGIKLLLCTKSKARKSLGTPGRPATSTSASS